MCIYMLTYMLWTFKYPLDNTVSIYSFHDRAQNNHIFFSFYNQINTSNVEMHGHSSVYSHCQLSAFILNEEFLFIMIRETVQNWTECCITLKEKTEVFLERRHRMTFWHLRLLKFYNCVVNAVLKTSFVFYITCAHSICSSWFMLIH